MFGCISLGIVFPEEKKFSKRRILESRLIASKWMEKQDKKRVIMIAYSNYLTDARIRREAETLASTQEYEVTVLTLNNCKKDQTYNNRGVIIRELTTSKYQGKSLFRYMLSYLKFMAEAFRWCTRMVREKKIWSVHVHNIPNFLIFAGLVPRLWGGKLILDIHDSVPETYAAKFGNLSRGLLFRLLCLEEAICCSLANRIICVNHPQKDMLIKRGIDADKIVISMNVPDPHIFKLQESRETETRGETGFSLVYHGTLAKRLGLDLIIQAVARLAREIPGLEFYALGVGDDQGAFEELARTLEVDRFVHFTGMIPLEKLPGILKEMDLGIVANRKNIATELMLPVKMMEYIAIGIPVVAPRLKTIRYYFSDEMVGYFEPESVESLAETILTLYRDASKRKRQAQMARSFLAEYGWEKHQHDLLKMYRNLYQ
jgi:glycosyltransferase involved in cell wall biosynthesis